MANSLAPHEKAAIAESVAHPVDNELFKRIISYTGPGVPTPDVTAAKRALEERDKLRRRALPPTERVANMCGYDKIVWPLGMTPWVIAERWLQRDQSFLTLIASAKKSPPDAAEQLDKLRNKSAY